MSSSLIKPIGSLLRTDRNGFIINEARLENIRPPWTEAVEALIQAYRSHLGQELHSIYLRGSVPKGTAIAHIADLDGIAIVSSLPENLSWTKEVQLTLQKEFPFVTDFEFAVVALESLLYDPEFAATKALMKIQSVCVFGESLLPQLPPCKITQQLGQDLYGKVERGIARARKGIAETAKTDKGVESWCEWVMKRIIRAGFSCVMVREQAFTRDLYPCVELFKKYYPLQAEEMDQALVWAINPTHQRKELLRYLDSFGAWLAEEMRTQGISTYQPEHV